MAVNTVLIYFARLTKILYIINHGGNSKWPSSEWKDSPAAKALNTELSSEASYVPCVTIAE